MVEEKVSEKLKKGESSKAAKNPSPSENCFSI
jgi:hypothetical protein